MRKAREARPPLLHDNQNRTGQLSMENNFKDRFWTSPDGLKLHFRDYPGGQRAQARPPIICLPGLTRNARDFHELATHLLPDWRVISINNRGRGDSEYAPNPMSYNPATYVTDLHALLEQEQIAKFIAIGTSLGGLMTMIVAAASPERLAGAVINDIGPVIDLSGIERIRDYVGQAKNYPSWMHAARALSESGGATFPNYTIEDWLVMAKRSMALGSNGRISFDYDMKIAESFASADHAVPPDLWPAYAALSACPLLVLRGELSDLLSADTVAEMQQRTPDAQFVTVPSVGHAPMLDEPEALAAIDRFLGGLE